MVHLAGHFAWILFRLLDLDLLVVPVLVLLLHDRASDIGYIIQYMQRTAFMVSLMKAPLSLI